MGDRDEWGRDREDRERDAWMDAEAAMVAAEDADAEALAIALGLWTAEAEEES